MGIVVNFFTVVNTDQNEENRVKESRKDMKSRGLSIVPVEWTLQVANSNAADYWSLAMGKNFSPPSTAKQ